MFEIGEWIVALNRFVSDRDIPISFSPYHGGLFRQPLDLSIPNKTLSSLHQNHLGPASSYFGLWAQFSVICDALGPMSSMSLV